MCVYREAEQDFEEIHGTLRRGDMIGVKGHPGMYGVHHTRVFNFHMCVCVCVIFSPSILS